MTAVLLCADLETLGWGIDLATVVAWLETAIPAVRPGIVPALCDRLAHATAHSPREVPDRLVLGLCARPRARAELQAPVRRVGIDPLTVEIVDLGTYAARAHPRPRVLAHLLARHARADVGAVAHPHSPFGLVTAAPGCTLCGACAAACPAGALLLQHDATGATLSFAAARCTACGLCLPACPEPGVLALARITDLQRLCSGPVVLACSEHRRCAACGAPFAVEAMAAQVAALLGEASTAARLVARLCPACRPVAIGSPPDGPGPPLPDTAREIR